MSFNQFLVEKEIDMKHFHNLANIWGDDGMIPVYRRVAKLHNELKEHYKIHNKEAIDNIRHYTHNGYERINGQLWDDHHSSLSHRLADHGKDVHLYNDTKHTIDNIQETLHRYKTPKPMSVYSSITKPLVPNESKIYHHAGFLSTSIDHMPLGTYTKGISKSSKNPDGSFIHEVHYHTLRIKVPKDHPGMYVDHFSENEGEKEFILPHGTNLKHIHTTLFTEKNKYKKTFRHYHTMSIVK